MVHRNTTTIAEITARPQKPAGVALPEVPPGGMNPAISREVHVRRAVLPCFAAVVGVLTAIAACSDSNGERNCRVNADCASNLCGSDGTCLDVIDAGTPAPIGTGIPTDDDDDLGTPDSGRPADDGGGYKAPGCVGNKDGIITREEVPLQAGLHAIFRFASDVEIKTEGVKQDDGTRKWDLSVSFPEKDTNVLIETKDPASQWWSSEYPSATYYTPLGKSPDILAIFENAQGSLVLRGAVSTASSGPTKTDLHNQDTVRTLDFGEGGLFVGKRWSDKTTVSGVSPTVSADGGFVPSGPISYNDKYDNSVDAKGELTTPLGVFPVLRVRIDLTRTVPFNGQDYPVFTTRTYAFVTECYGNVASIVSGFNETQEEFTKAAEIRRISP